MSIRERGDHVKVAYRLHLLMVSCPGLNMYRTCLLRVDDCIWGATAKY